MTVNIFEGARRIAKLLGGFWVIGCLSFAIFSESYSQIIYAVLTYNSAPVLVEKCFDDDAKEYLNPSTSDGRTINVILCFVAHKADTGELLVPYADAGNGKVWLGERYSSEVTRYTKGIAAKFELTAKGIEAANAKHRDALFEQWKNALLFLFGGLAVGLGLTVAAGWIVRGFMGIPKGQDIRPVP